MHCVLTVNGTHAFASLWLTNNAVLTHSADALGGGSIAANGGNSTTGGGGGGGRIAVVYGSSTFTGSISAVGGAGSEYGGAGTVYTKLASAPAGQVMLDNANHAGQWTPLSCGIMRT